MVIGITGGVGCGKSTVLNLLEEKYGAKIIEADALGHEARYLSRTQGKRPQ